MKEIKNKKSQLCFEPKVARKLLKLNGELKFCPYCGTALVDGCDCHKNIVVDIKANRENAEKTIFVFDNNESFKTDFNQLMDELKAKKEAEQEIEFEFEVEVDLD